jgi:hypothetical protein
MMRLSLEVRHQIIKILALQNIFLLLFGLWGYWHCGQSWPIVLASGDNEDDCGEADWM